MPFDPDAYLAGNPAQNAQPPANQQPKNVPRGFDPNSYLTASAGPATTDHAPTTDWANLYGGLDGLPDRLTPQQAAAFRLAEQNSDNPKEARARSVNQSYLSSTMPGMDQRFISDNWQAVKDSYAQWQLGMPAKGISDTELYGKIGARMKQVPEDWNDTMLHGLWQGLNQPFVAMPEVPKNLPDKTYTIPTPVGTVLINPAVVGGMYESLKPILQGAETPLGVATMGVGAELKAASATYPLAKAALVGMQGIFAGLMGYEAVTSAPSGFRQAMDSKLPLQQRIAGAGKPLAQAAASLMGLLGAALEMLPHSDVPPLLSSMQNKTPGQAADMLRGEAATMKPGPHADAAVKAADALDKVEKSRVDMQNAVAQGLGRLDKPAPTPEIYPTTSGAMQEEGPFNGVTEWKAEDEIRPRFGISRANMDRALEENGMEPSTPAEYMSRQEALDNAQKKMRRNPAVGMELLDKLEKRPRALNDDEVALVTLELARLERSLHEARQEYTNAVGTPYEAEALMARAGAQDAFVRATELVRQAKTKNARAMAFLNMAVQPDDSLASHVEKWTLANNGPLKPEQMNELADLHRQLTDTKREFDKYREQQQAQQTPAAQRMGRGPSPAALKGLSDAAEAARKRIVDRMSQARVNDVTQVFSMAKDAPAIVADLAIVGADLIAKGAVKFADWGEQMAKEYGDEIRPFLKEIFGKSLEHFQSERQEASRLEAVKKRTEARIIEKAGKVEAGDFSKEERRPVPLDARALELKGQENHINGLLELGRKKLERDQMSASSKALDWTSKAATAGVISAPPIFAKITLAGVLRPITTLMEQGVGYGLSKLVPDYAERAPREGVTDLQGAAKAEASGLIEMGRSVKELPTVARGKQTAAMKLNEKPQLPPEWIETVGLIHKSLQYPAQMNEYARSLELRIQHAVRNGVDPTDPIQQLRLMHEAWQDGKRAVFQNDTMLNSMIQKLLNAPLVKDAETGKTRFGGEAVHTLGKVLVPVSKVPSAAFTEVLNYIVGAPVGAVRVAAGYIKGLENVGPNEADAVMRSMKKGGVGLGLAALGFFMHEEVGGFRQEGVRKRHDDVPDEGVRTPVGEVPPYLASAGPAFTALQFGSTLWRASEAAMRNQGVKTNTPKLHGVLAASLGLVDEVPGVSVMTGGLLETRKAGDAINQRVASLIIPGGVAWVAAVMDKEHPLNPNEKPQSRKVEDTVDAIKKDIPGLRQTLPKGPNR